MITTNYLIISNKNIIFYIENNNYFMYSISSIRKYKNSNNYFINILNNEIIINCYFFMKNVNEKKEKINYKNTKFIKESFYENKSKLKIIGRGWKIIKYQYQLLIKLGYSHMIFLNLCPILKNKQKKKKKNTTYIMVYLKII